MSNKIDVKGLVVSIKDKDIIKGIDLEVHERECLVIMGASGSGKSVLVKTLLGFNQIDEGTIIINGCERPTTVSENCVRNNIGVVFQNVALIDDFCLWENVAFRLIHQYRVTKKTAKDRAIKQLAQVGLELDSVGKFPEELSVGMGRRAAIARALFTNPEIVIMDEPTAGLDPASSNLVVKIIKELINRTVVVVTHDLDLCHKIADRVVFVQEGQIVAQHHPADMLSSQDPYVRSFFH